MGLYPKYLLYTIAMNKRTITSIKIASILIPLVLVIPHLHSLMFKRELNIINNPGVSVRFYSDSAEGGNSKIQKFFRDDTSLNLEFVLHKGFNYPFSGIAVEPLPYGSVIDLSAYDFLQLTIKRNKTQDIKIHIRTFVPGLTVPQRTITQRFSEVEVNCMEYEQTFKISMKNFSTPSWWYAQNKLDVNSLDRERYKRVLSIIFQSGSSTQIDQDMSIKLSGISFRKDIAGRLRSLLLFCCVYYAVISGVWVTCTIVRTRKKAAPRVEISYTPVMVANYLDEDCKRITEYISHNYSNPDLSLDKVAHEVGLGSKKISRILNETLQCNFKQYLNGIRITEAKRLLKETDRQIADISRKVGYQNVTHFNRTFKLAEGMSPNQFRTGA